MNISFDKALLWLIPYLYLVSIAYYWGFWGSFNIDAFNYYPVTDLVKGVTAPLRTTLPIVLSVGFIVIYIKHEQSGKSYKDFVKLTTIMVALTLVLQLIYFIIKKVKHQEEDDYSMPSQVVTGYITMTFVLLSGSLAYIINSKLSPISIFDDAVRYSGIFFLCLLPCQSYISGRENSIQIR